MLLLGPLCVIESMRGFFCSVGDLQTMCLEPLFFLCARRVSSQIQLLKKEMKDRNLLANKVENVSIYP